MYYYYYIILVEFSSVHDDQDDDEGNDDTHTSLLSIELSVVSLPCLTGYYPDITTQHNIT